MMMAMAGMMGGLENPSMPEPKQRPKPRKLSPEEEVIELEKRKEKFFLDLAIHNEERKVKFPKFKEFEVYGLPIIAFSLKNATRDMNSLMHQNQISMKPE